ncbi:flagellar basal body-associated FliL family protein [Leisingera aquaemixtae]|uniref:flagellar basal body-associated FliL family protein n=1 Tax=Leisingera TaxID=191028 RepID=UPI001C97CBF3|nr:MULTISPECIES: flagellar basal body-associated FliL family protein [Leisingera]MBY6066424.1 flagellar basal body-associated FliL family protein [Leisingera aquaemixtae]MCB4456281.1 flagellar basal body-associated FliL family protein [Leisingera sp. McT4-56]
MLSKLLPVILLILGTGGGIGAGIMLAPAPEEQHAAAGGGAAPAPAAFAEEPAEEGEEALREYIKITNQFVVPVVDRDQLTSLVVISLSLETAPGAGEKIRAFEPKLRDVFLQVLFDHANMGGFRGAFTRSDILEPLRTALREAAQKHVGKTIHDVLIMEISRQDV